MTNFSVSHSFSIMTVHQYTHTTNYYIISISNTVNKIDLKKVTLITIGIKEILKNRWSELIPLYSNKFKL